MPAVSKRASRRDGEWIPAYELPVECRAKSLFSYQDHHRYPEMERRYVERMFQDFPRS